ncbi:MAG: putative transposase [bacterium]|jgi:putative transposase
MVVQNRRRLFGDIKKGMSYPNQAGTMITKWYTELENKFPNVRCHEKIVMPDHFHCIIEITVGADLDVADLDVADLSVCPKHPAMPRGEHGGSPLGTILQWFKTMSTNEYIRKVKSNDWQRFDGKLWQRNYYERIITNKEAFYRVSEYIRNNPMKFEEDRQQVK